VAGGDGMSSALTQQLDGYLTMRRALGFKLKEPARLLRHYVAYLDSIGAGIITVDSAMAWATSAAQASPWYVSLRMGAVRGFARHMASLDPATEVPPPDLLAAQYERLVPFLYSADDVAALMDAAGRCRTPLVGATYRTLIGLLAVTGMRVGEAIHLDRDDVDWDQSVLVVRDSKFGKSREVALHLSALAALKEYALIRDRHCPDPHTKAWFISSTGTRLIYNNVHLRFHRLTQVVGLVPRSPRCRPRIHDLRHTFAATTLLGWYQSGEDVAAKMALLSTYLGHIEPVSTYWYLTATPELMQLVAQRLAPIGPVS
jgi:integrase